MLAPQESLEPAWLTREHHPRDHTLEPKADSTCNDATSRSSAESVIPTCKLVRIGFGIVVPAPVTNEIDSEDVEGAYGATES